MPNVIYQKLIWYESHLNGLGNEFLLCVDACIQNISRNPEFYQKIHKNIRRALIRRFPYGIFYIEHDTYINVLAVFMPIATQKHGKEENKSDNHSVHWTHKARQ